MHIAIICGIIAMYSAEYRVMENVVDLVLHRNYEVEEKESRKEKIGMGNEGCQNE